MILKKLYGSNGWKFAEYQTTWPYGWDFMLDAAQQMVDADLLESDAELLFGVKDLAGAPMTDITDEVEDTDYELRECETLQREWGVLMLTGVSPILKNIQIQVEFYNQTGMLRIGTNKPEIFDGDENALTTYVCSMEIKAYCAATERDLLEELGGVTEEDDDYEDDEEF